MDAFFDFLLEIILWLKETTGLPQWLCATIVLLAGLFIVIYILKSLWQGIVEGNSDSSTSGTGGSSGGGGRRRTSSNAGYSSNRSDRDSEEEKRKRSYQGFLETKYEEDKYR